VGLEGYWTRHPISDEAEFRGQVMDLVGQAHAMFLNGDIESAGDIRRCFQRARPACCNEPLSTVYDHGLILFALLYSGYAAMQRSWAIAYRCVERARLMIPACNEHRLEHSRQPRQFSEALWSSHRILADIKWQAPRDGRDRAATPERIIAEHMLVSQQARARLTDDYPGGPEKAQRLLGSLTWATLAVIKMATRFMVTRRVAKLIAHFDQTVGAGLRCGVGHFRELGSSEPYGRAAYYWDYELAKLVLAGELNQHDLDYLHTKRCEALHAEGHAEVLDQQALLLQYRWLKSRCRPQLEVVSA